MKLRPVKCNKCGTEMKFIYCQSIRKTCEPCGGVASLHADAHNVRKRYFNGKVAKDS